MAESTSREGVPATTTTTTIRRQSFRQALADHAENGLPTAYLEALEQKRKQLDESIHKYIAAKEREYKQFEKDVRLQHKLAPDKDGPKPRRSSSESSHNALGPSRLQGQQSSAVNTLLAAGLKREQIGHSVAVAVVDGDGPQPTLETGHKLSAELADRRASVDRDREFVGVFTPAFLPALGSKGPDQSASTEDTPPADSDEAVEGKQKRRADLQLVQRNSSSGSSADSKLTSVLKSPTQPPQTKRKRVSLAVGDTIVKPSDSVPSAMSHNSTPSHSKIRSPGTSQLDDPPADNAIDSLRDVAGATASPQPPSPAIEPAVDGELDRELPKHELSVNNAAVEPSPAMSTALISAPPKSTQAKINPDGDLFDLQDEEDHSPLQFEDDESEDDVTGRVGLGTAESETYDADAGQVPNESAITEVGDSEDVEFRPGSAVASQQPVNPGFRRPSATYDPIYRGVNYERAEQSAAVDDVYGSSFNRPTTKGSFTAGSLGESFMAQNAERLMRNRTNSQD